MDEKIESLYTKYPIKVDKAYKSKGIIYLETKDGLYIIKTYNNSEKKIRLENKIKEELSKKGYSDTDMYMQNEDKEYITLNRYGTKHVMKKWSYGRECDIMSIDDICIASANLARLHKLMQGIELDTIEKKEESEEQDKLSYGVDMTEETEQNIDERKEEHTISRLDRKNLVKEYITYINELRRVKKYISNKKKKNKLELEILKSLEYYQQQGQQYLKKMQESEYLKLYEEAQLHNRLCHGNYTHHSLLIGSKEQSKEDQVTTINFDKVHIGVQVYDLYILLRKTMEKNEWNIEYAKDIIKAYDEIKPLTQAEREIMVILFGYPEKYRKLINSYYNGKKTWLSIRIYEKLEELLETEQKRKSFIQGLNEVLGVDV